MMIERHMCVKMYNDGKVHMAQLAGIMVFI